MKRLSNILRLSGYACAALLLTGLASTVSCGGDEPSTTTSSGTTGSGGAGGTGGTATTTVTTGATMTGTGGTGGGMPCAQPTDCDDNNACTVDDCQAGQCSHTPEAVGTQCDMGSICTATGDCLPCANGMQDGDETGVDCGGSCPNKCLGSACTMGTDCPSGFCADGVCCDTACDASSECMACNVPGKEGTCSAVSKGMQDPDTCAGADQVCDGTCKSAGGKKLVGELCLGNNDCYNNRCIAGNICGLSKGEPCSEDYVCANKLCENNVCVECTMDAQCASGMCDTNSKACKIPLGEPCTGTAVPPCSAGSCTGKICHLADGAMCAASGECIGFCDPGTNQCAACMSDNDCGAGKCNGGACLLAAGSTCVDNAQCASGMCTGFPPKCQ